MRLTNLKQRQAGTLRTINLPQQDVRRLFHLGFYPGIQIRFIRKAPMGDPSIYEVCGNEIILRDQDAKQIEVEEII